MRGHYSAFPDSSVGKESTCSVGDPGLIPGSRRSLEKGRLPTPVFLGFPYGSAGKESACNVGEFDPWVGKIPWKREMGKATHPSILGLP